MKNYFEIKKSLDVKYTFSSNFKSKNNIQTKLSLSNRTIGHQNQYFS